SYSPYARSQHPDYGDRPTAEQIRADLKILSPYTQAIRTYSSTGGGELVPAIAAEFGLKVTLGIWIDKNEARNEREIQAAIALARRYSNINAIVVGNETTLRAEKSIDELVRLIQRVKRQSPVPVTTGEIWTVWIEHPELASAVDFIAAHILPYWDGFTTTQAVDKTIEFYDKLRSAHPGKRIVIAEVGWPSAGYNMRDADRGRIEQATVLLGCGAVTFGEAATLAVAANAAGAWFATVFAFWQTHYFVLGAAFALGLGVLLLAPLVAIALARIEEIAVVAFGRGPRRLIAAALPAAEGFAPKVSIHIPAHREPPEMLKATL